MNWLHNVTFVLLTGLFVCLFGSFVFFVYSVLGPPPTLNQKHAKAFSSSKQEPLTEVKATNDHRLSTTEMKKRFFEEGVVGPFKLFDKSDLRAFLSHKGRRPTKNHTNQKSIY